MLFLRLRQHQHLGAPGQVRPQPVCVDGIFIVRAPVHSFAAEPCAATIATTDYGRPFSAALGSGNFFGTQFHPEKSGAAGARILLNFLNL